MPIVECVRGKGAFRHRVKLWADTQQQLRAIRGKTTLHEAAKRAEVNVTFLQYVENGFPFSPELADALATGYGTTAKRLREVFK